MRLILLTLLWHHNDVVALVSWEISADENESTYFFTLALCFYSFKFFYILSDHCDFSSDFSGEENQLI